MYNARVIFFLLLLASPAILFSQNDLKWVNPAFENFRTIHNQLWYGEELQSCYDRLPARAKQAVRKEVWSLSKNAAGLKIVFKTNAETISVRYTTSKDKTNYAMPHFPATGVSGVDLFAENSDGSWSWANGSFRFGDTIRYNFNGIKPDKVNSNNERIFHLYLPLYNSVNQLEIGIPEGKSFGFIPPSEKKPIVVYGTSIAQGGCASRPGMAWPALLERKLHRPVVNLGFSGNGRLEKEVLELILNKEAEIFILDCLPNLGGAINNVRQKTIDAVKMIREKYPLTPIILADHSRYTEGWLNDHSLNTITELNKAGYEAYSSLQSQGVKYLYYLKREAIGLTMDDSVDGVHPTDIGMIKYANAYEQIIKHILRY